jgi:hypothetical protein
MGSVHLAALQSYFDAQRGSCDRGDEGCSQMFFAIIIACRRLGCS